MHIWSNFLQISFKMLFPSKLLQKENLLPGGNFFRSGSTDHENICLVAMVPDQTVRDGWPEEELEGNMEADSNSRNRHRRSRFSLQTNIKMDYGPKYSKVSESLRHATSGSVQCSMFCGGRQCKYENPGKWSDAEMAIKGLYSSWCVSYWIALKLFS